MCSQSSELVPKISTLAVTCSVQLMFRIYLSWLLPCLFMVSFMDDSSNILENVCTVVQVRLCVTSPRDLGNGTFNTFASWIWVSFNLQVIYEAVKFHSSLL